MTPVICIGHSKTWVTLIKTWATHMHGNSLLKEYQNRLSVFLGIFDTILPDESETDVRYSHGSLIVLRSFSLSKHAIMIAVENDSFTVQLRFWAVYLNHGSSCSMDTQCTIKNPWNHLTAASACLFRIANSEHPPRADQSISLVWIKEASMA